MNANQAQALPRWLVALLGLLFVLSLGWLMYGNVQAGMEGWNLISSGLLLSVPLILLYFSIGLFVLAWRQHSLGKISPRVSRYLYRTPRIAGVVITLFVSLFALDVFSAGGNIWQMLLGFAIHALPAIIMAVVLIFAWRREWLGAVVFFAAAIYFLRFILRDPLHEIGIFLLFAGPMAAIGLLFWANWKWKGMLRSTTL